MRKNNLVPNKGLSLSQAQSISNLCYQRANEISQRLGVVNNYSKYITIDGNNVCISKGVALPDNVIELLIEKSKLHACQAFLMENIKVKDKLLQEAKLGLPDLSSLVKPEKPKLIDSLDKNIHINEVSEEFGWSELTTNEYNEYLMVEAYASHIGQFIHKGSILNRLRDELTNVPDVEWIELEKDKKSLVNISVHHLPLDLLELHEKLATMHRKYEQRVNYFKAKVKDLTTIENARISKHNADAWNVIVKENAKLTNKYNIEMIEYQQKVDTIRKEFEKVRHARISEIASMRINVDERFQDTVDMFLNILSKE